MVYGIRHNEDSSYGIGRYLGDFTINNSRKYCPVNVTAMYLTESI